MRDLKTDLEICKKASPGPWKFTDDTIIDSNGRELLCIGYKNVLFINADTNQPFIEQARKGWPEAIKRAIKAEAQVAKTQELLELLRRIGKDYMPIAVWDALEGLERK